MKLLILASRFPYPLEKGDKLRIYHQIRLLSQEHEICLFALSREDIKDAWISELEPYCAGGIHWQRLRHGGNALAILKTTFDTRPWQTGLFYRKSANRLLTKIIEQWKPDRVYCQLARMGKYIEHINVPVTLDFMDAFSMGMERRAEKSGWPLNWLFREEARRMANYERFLLDKIDDCTIIAQPDADRIGEGIRIVPNGVDLDYFSPKESDKQHELVFVGNLSYFPNVKASQVLVNDILPQLKKDTRLLLAGASPVASVKALAGSQVTIPGWIDDIREAYLSGKVFVAPLFTGSGQQNKLLEAMALGIPCVTSSIVNNALGATPDEHLLVADSVSEFSTKLAALLEDEEMQRRIGAAGREFVEANFSWEKAVEVLF